LSAEPRLIARNAAARAVGELVAKFGSLAFFVVMARRLGSVGFGEFQFALALTGALIYVAGFGTDDLIAREASRERARSGRLLSDAIWIKLIGGIVMLGVAASIVGAGDYTRESRLVVLVVGVGTLFEVASKSWFSIFQAYQRLELASATLILQRIVTAAVGIVVLLSGGGVVAASAVYAGGALFAVCVAELWLRRLGVRRGAVEWAELVPVARAAVPIGLISLLAIVLLRLDVTMLSFLGDAAKVGVYAVSFRLVEATQFLGAALSAAMLPWLARGGRPGGIGVARGYALGLKAINGLLLPIGLALVLFAAPVIDLLYGNDFGAAVLPLQLLGMMALTFGLNAFASMTLIARDRPGAYARLIAPVIVQNVVFNLVLIPRYGANGAAFDAMFSSALLALLALWQARVVVGPSDLVGSFAGPLAAGAAMTALVLVVSLPWPVELVLGVAVYAAVLGTCEWVMRREDVRVFLRVLPDPLASRLPGGRTAA